MAEFSELNSIFLRWAEDRDWEWDSGIEEQRSDFCTPFKRCLESLARNPDSQTDRVGRGVKGFAPAAPLSIISIEKYFADPLGQVKMNYKHFLFVVAVAASSASSTDFACGLMFRENENVKVEPRPGQNGNLLPLRNLS